MASNNELTCYMNGAIEQMVKDILKSTLQNPKETAYLFQLRAHTKRNEKRRLAQEAAGQHIPAFLICSITHTCNLFCAGCYARANGLCAETAKMELLSAAKWRSIFEQAAELGISFSLLAGGEPLLRRDVMEEAAKVESVTFPIFTNGTLIDEAYASFFDAHRNLVPVLSIEGGRQRTDARRGEGTYEKLMDTMALLKAHKLLFGVSVTVTRENLIEVTSEAFMDMLQKSGCRLVFFIEYVPADPSTRHLAPTDEDRALLEEKQDALRLRYPSISFISFPGDEKYMGGCLAAGRGFFHINPYGSAEPCPFSPYSDRSLTDHTLLEVLQSPLFRMLQTEGLVGGEHIGGCALFEQEALVKQCLQQ